MRPHPRPSRFLASTLLSAMLLGATGAAATGPGTEDLPCAAAIVVTDSVVTISANQKRIDYTFTNPDGCALTDFEIPIPSGDVNTDYSVTPVNLTNVSTSTIGNGPTRQMRIRYNKVDTTGPFSLRVTGPADGGHNPVASTVTVTYNDAVRGGRRAAHAFAVYDASGIPTLSEWGLILLAAMMTGTTIIVLRRQRPAANGPV